MKTLFRNGRIFTSNRRSLYADAMLVEDGVIRWVGSESEGNAAEEASQALAADADSCAIIDLGGRTIIPGFIDAHMHPLMLAEYSRQIACLPPAINSIEELKEAIHTVYTEKRQPQSDLPWILGWGYDEGKYREGRSPNRCDLDEASPDLPVFLVRSCEHIRCVNSKALEIAGITRDTPDPPGGEIERDADGVPTGILKENARDLVLPYLPAHTEEEILEALVHLGELLLSQGITGVSDMGNLHEGRNYDLYCKSRERGFRQRAALYDMWDYCMDDPAYELTPAKMDYRNRIRVAGIKLIGDGSISGQTAWLYEPYLGTENIGLAVYSDESMEKAIAFAKRTGCQLAVHAMGGRAIDRVLKRITCEEDWKDGYMYPDCRDDRTDGRVPRVRMEHVTEPTEEMIREAARCGVGFTSQPIFEFCEIETYRKNMDAERLQRLYPHRRELESGVKLAFSTDAPATSWAVPSDPFPNLKAAVTRLAYDGTDIGQDERLTIEQAVILYTKEAAEISGMAGAGMLAPGYDADFAVLSEDLFSIDPMQISEVRVLETWILGECVYRAEE